MEAVRTTVAIILGVSLLALMGCCRNFDTAWRGVEALRAHKIDGISTSGKTLASLMKLNSKLPNRQVATATA
jgi:hypothetical protein